MSRKNNQETEFSSNKNQKGKTSAHKEHMPIARCICGFEILVVPDLKAMNLAISKHLMTTHKKEFDAAEEKLTEQVLIVASNTNPTTLSQLVLK
jgi:hypothetical protein